MNAGLVICFSGRIGSGKSSVTKALANALHWRRASFGDYVRARVAEQGGDPASREDLQNLGQALVEANPEAFAVAVIHAAGYEQIQTFWWTEFATDAFRRRLPPW